MQRSLTELPSLKQFRTICLICTGIALCLLLLVNIITFAPSAVWAAGRAALFLSLVALYFLIIATRTHVLIYQLTRGASQTFDRPAPERITVPLFLAAIGAIVGPHFQ